jgi:hypothetical protein
MAVGTDTYADSNEASTHFWQRPWQHHAKSPCAAVVEGNHNRMATGANVTPLRKA